MLCGRPISIFSDKVQLFEKYLWWSSLLKLHISLNAEIEKFYLFLSYSYAIVIIIISSEKDYIKDSYVTTKRNRFFIYLFSKFI